MVPDNTTFSAGTPTASPLPSRGLPKDLPLPNARPSNTPISSPVREEPTLVEQTQHWWAEERSSPERTSHNIDAVYIKQCKLRSFNPNTLLLSNIDIVFTLGRIFGPGITRAQFKQIFRECRLCGNICFVEKRHLHRCDGSILLTQADGFDFVGSVLSFEEHAGFSSFDIHRLLTQCGTCQRLIQEGTLGIHECEASN